MRKNIVAGNWKMNKDKDEGISLASEIGNILADEPNVNCEVILNPPYIHLTSIARLLKEYPSIKLGAQNCHQEDSGAFTGEISVSMLKSIPVEYVILGHSERREYFDESDELLAKKVNVVLAHNLKPIFCCGESLAIRENNEHVSYVKEQLTNSLFHLSSEQLQQLVIAYEPIWAIGTGRTASADQAQEMHEEIRMHLAGKFGQDVADEISILYGGSVKPDNATEIFSKPDVDGGLIGGASLKSRDFVNIIKAFS